MDDIIARMAEEDGVFLPAEGTWADMLDWCGYFVEAAESWCKEELAHGEKSEDVKYCPEIGGVPIEDVNSGLAPKVLAEYLKVEGGHTGPEVRRS